MREPPLRVIWGAMLGATVAYAPIAGLLAGQGARSLVPAAWVAAGAAGVLSFALPGRVFPAGAPRADFARCLLSWALAEAVALIGVILALLGGSWAESAPFFGVALGLLVWHRPGRGEQMPPGPRDPRGSP